MTAGVCHIFDSYINVWISGQSAQDSHGWYLSFSFYRFLMNFVRRFYLLVRKNLQAERNIMTNYLVYGHNWERYDLRRKFDIQPIMWLMLKKLSLDSIDFTVTIFKILQMSKHLSPMPFGTHTIHQMVKRCKRSFRSLESHLTVI